MNPHTPKWTPTLGVGVPMESRWSPESSKSNCKGQNSLDWSVPYTIEKLLKTKCLKWAYMTHLEYLKHKLWPKEWSGVKLPIWLLTIKSQELPLFTCVLVACHIPLESSRWRLHLCFRHLIEVICTKIYGPPKSWESQFRKFWDSQLGSLGTKWHLGVGPVAMHREYYKGEGGDFPKFRSWWVLWVCVCSWFVRASKVL
jgi:hypothetical protein